MIMDPSLRKEKEAFKRRALAAAEKSQKSREAASKAKSLIPIKKSKKRVYESAGNLLCVSSYV